MGNNPSVSKNIEIFSGSIACLVLAIILWIITYVLQIALKKHYTYVDCNVSQPPRSIRYTDCDGKPLSPTQVDQHKECEPFYLDDCDKVGQDMNLADTIIACFSVLISIIFVILFFNAFHNYKTKEYEKIPGI